MSISREAEQSLALTVSGWFKSFGGTSALCVSRDLSIDHAEVMHIFEQLADSGYGSLNRNVELLQVSFDSDNIKAGLKSEAVTTHIFFPSKEILRKSFFASEKAQLGLPEYTTRLHLGAHQIGLVFFSEEVLSRYMDHPEHYEINDSLAGGQISSLSPNPGERHLYVRYGKCQLASGQIAVTAIYKDLSDMTPSEQSYWYSHEIDSPSINKSDRHFQNFLKRTYEGAFVDYHDPIAILFEAMHHVNEVTPLFTKLSNVHLQLPVEQTYKSYCDAASELYKVLGPDSLSQSRLKDLLLNDLATPTTELVHAESQRPLSKLQLLTLVEQKLGAFGVYTTPLRTLGKLRIEADHKVLERDAVTKSYSREFASMCDELASALASLAKLLAGRIQIE